MTVSDEEIIAAWRELAELEGLFCETPRRRGSPRSRGGAVSGARLVVTITGHGLKDTENADRYAPPLALVDARSRRHRCGHARRVIVRAPATSANLGPGFDCVGVALDLWNELEVTDGDGVAVEGCGAGELALDQSNLGVRAFARLADPAGKRFRFVNRIPLERGLGSSAAAIALGLVAAAPTTEPKSSSRPGSSSSLTPTTSPPRSSVA